MVAPGWSEVLEGMVAGVPRYLEPVLSVIQLTSYGSATATGCSWSAATDHPPADEDRTRAFWDSRERFGPAFSGAARLIDGWHSGTRGCGSRYRSVDEVERGLRCEAEAVSAGPSRPSTPRVTHSRQSSWPVLGRSTSAG
jgi:hypothetical protein